MKKLDCCRQGSDLIFWEEDEIEAEYAEDTGKSAPCWCLAFGYGEVSIPIVACPFCGTTIILEDEHPEPHIGCGCIVCAETRDRRRAKDGG